MEDKKPWMVDARLEEDALRALAKLRLSIRNDVAKRQQPEKGDGPYGLGCSAFERFKHQILVKHKRKEFPWLSVIHFGSEFAVAVNGCPIRPYKGDPEDPPTRHLERARAQGQLFPNHQDDGSMWFLVDETDAYGHIEQVVVMQATEAGDILLTWIAATADDSDSGSVTSSAAPSNGTLPVSPITQVTDAPAPFVEPLTPVGAEKDSKK